MKNIVNVILFQAGWFAAVKLGSSGQGALGASLMLILASTSLFLSIHRKEKFLFMLVVALLGTCLDSLMLALGAFDFVSDSGLPWRYPIWMTALWYGFASTIDESLAWLESNKLLQVLFGFFGGAASYYIGAQFGEMFFPKGLEISLFLIGLFWAVAVPLMFFTAKRFKLFKK